MAMFDSARRVVPLALYLLIIAVLVLVPASGPGHAQDARARIGALNKASVQLLNAGKLTEAVANAEKALAEAERTLRPTDPLIGQSLNNLAILLGRAGRDADAGPIYKRMVAFREKVPGRGQIDLARGLAEFGIWAVKTGRPAEAEPMLRRSLTIREKSLGADNEDTLYVSLWLARSLYEADRFAEAETLAKRVAAAREKKSGANHADVADALGSLATIYRLQNRFEDTDSVYQRILSIREATLGKDDAKVGLLLNDMAANYDNAGRYAEAGKAYTRALAISEKSLGPDHRQVALVLGNFSGLQRKLGRNAEALALAERSLGIYEKQAGQNSREVANASNRIGNVLLSIEKPKDAEAHFRRSLAINEKLFGSNAAAVATALSNVSVSLENQGQVSEAEALQRRAIAINERRLGAEHPDVATMLINLAILYDKQDRSRDAEALHKRAFAIREKALGANHPLIANSLNYLGQADLRQDRLADAEAKFSRTAAILEKAQGRDHPDVADTLNNLAVVYGRTGRLKEEQEVQQRVLQIRTAYYGPEHFFVAQSLNNMARNAERRGRTEEAETLYRRAAAMGEKLYGPTNERTGVFLRNLAAITNERGKHSEAVSHVRRAAASGSIDKGIYISIMSDAANNNVIRGADAIDESFIIVQDATASAAAGAVNKLAARFAAGTGALAEIVRNDQDLAAESEALDRKLTEALGQAPARRDAALEDAMRSRLEAIAAERARISDRLKSDFPDYASLSAPPAVSMAETKALLADDEALVLVDTDRSIFVFAVTQKSAELHRHSNSKESDIGNLRALTKRVRSSISQGLQAVGDKNMPAFDAAAAYEIYNATFKKAENLIAGKPKLAVILSGTLTGIPPHLLVTSDPGGKSNSAIDWLVKRHEITVYPSVSAFKLARSKSAGARAPKPLTGYANPVFGPAAPDAAKRGVAKPSLASFYSRGGVDLDSLSRSLAPLPETEDELKSVGKNVKAAAADLKFGKIATETDVKKARLADYRVLYFATHALVAGETALFVRNEAEPAIALTIPAKATETDDGLLTASEIAQLKLNADWVILSACNTASGDGNPGAEPLSGLARAFFYAGARSLLVSHWEVPSLSAVPLLIGIFEAKSGNPGLSNAGALRQAMLAQLNDAKNPSWSHPVHWAPFIVVGDAQ